VGEFGLAIRDRPATRRFDVVSLIVPLLDDGFIDDCASSSAMQKTHRVATVGF
jgi:hypothetical protein